LWNFEIEQLKQSLDEGSFYEIGPNILKLYFSKSSDTSYYLQSISHLILEKRDICFDFQLFFFETDFVKIKIPEELTNWENIDSYSGRLLGLPASYVD
jgi:hypothetical protein